jgi:hypothetical protein
MSFCEKLRPKIIFIYLLFCDFKFSLYLSLFIYYPNVKMSEL